MCNMQGERRAHSQPPSLEMGSPSSAATPAFEGMLQTSTRLEVKDATSHPGRFPCLETAAVTVHG